MSERRSMHRELHSTASPSRALLWLGAMLLLLGCPEEPPAVPPPAEPDPGRLTIQRLNRAEYDNTVRDLLGTETTPARNFPPDDHGYGFDNIGDVLSMSPLHFELYEQAAEDLAAEYMAPAVGELQTWHFEAESGELVASTGGGNEVGWNLWANGSLESPSVTLPADGSYTISARVYGHQVPGDLVEAALTADGGMVGMFDVEAATAKEMEILSAERELTAGAHSFGISFLNDFYDPEAGLDRNLVVDWIRLEGPTDLAGEPNPRLEQLAACEEAGGEPADCALELLEPLALRAFRSPPEPEELEGFVELVDAALAEGDDLARGVELAVHRMLVSPRFLFRVELDPDPEDETPHLLTDYELASRLSYFLWSSMPDDELLELAAAGELQDLGVLEAQARRMLQDERAEALVDNFAGQWLDIRAIEDAFPDPWYFPDFDEELQASLAQEMSLFFATFLNEDRSMLELLSAEQSFVDARLAEHYGLEGAFGEDFEEVDVTSAGRGGLLAQGGFLAVQAFPTRTSPVKRGQWVLGRLLCQAPGAPPEGVEGLPQEALEDGATLREILEAHRSDPSCAACHASMDPIGLGLEHFDAIGAWRDEDAGQPVDATGELPDGSSFDGAQELQQILKDDPAVPGCIARHLTTYALGRGVLLASDRPYLSTITADFVASGHRFEGLVVALVTSDLFRMRRGEAP